MGFTRREFLLGGLAVATEAVAACAPKTYSETHKNGVSGSVSTATPKEEVIFPVAQTPTIPPPRPTTTPDRRTTAKKIEDSKSLAAAIRESTEKVESLIKRSKEEKGSNFAAFGEIAQATSQTKPTILPETKWALDELRAAEGEEDCDTRLMRKFYTFQNFVLVEEGVDPGKYLALSEEKLHELQFRHQLMVLIYLGLFLNRAETEKMTDQELLGLFLAISGEAKAIQSQTSISLPEWKDLERELIPERQRCATPTPVATPENSPQLKN